MCYSNVFDFYDVGITLGKGQFGLVKLASHTKTGASVAIKMVKKANMKQIEIF
jgi:serine/threonine protein kinase